MDQWRFQCLHAELKAFQTLNKETKLLKIKISNVLGTYNTISIIQVVWFVNMNIRRLKKPNQKLKKNTQYHRETISYTILSKYQSINSATINGFYLHRYIFTLNLRFSVWSLSIIVATALNCLGLLCTYFRFCKTLPWHQKRYAWIAKTSDQLPLSMEFVPLKTNSFVALL